MVEDTILYYRQMKQDIPTGSLVAERLSLPEVVYRELRKAIMEGEFPPGQVLRQDEIARRFGVSRAPLREALPRLEAEGIVTFNPRHGYSVAALEPEDVLEIFRLRAIIEQDAARQAVAVRTPADTKRLKELLDELVRTSANAAAFSEWATAHFAFHQALLAPSNFRRHTKLVDSLRVEVESYMRANTAATGIARQSNDEHKLMYLAFKNGDADKLAQLIGEHCAHTAERLLNYLERVRAEQAMSA
jgi:DNA-binding GntR family transcriptional regulator